MLRLMLLFELLRVASLLHPDGKTNRRENNRERKSNPPVGGWGRSFRELFPPVLKYFTFAVI